MPAKYTCNLLFFFLFSLSWTQPLQAQYAVGKPYFCMSGEGFILSTTLQQRQGEGFNLSTPRFTGLVNFGVNLHYDFSRRAGIYTGLGLKNIGFIEKYNNPDSTVKRRVYTIGIPVGLKWGDVRYGSYFVVGGGIDIPFNYREKGFTERGHKTKFNEWFSSRTPAVMPYIFIGAHLRPALLVKLQYYPLNFMNTDYADQTIPAHIVHPYQDYKVQLLLLTFGFDIPLRPKN